jgi:hypothetical protein
MLCRGFCILLNVCFTFLLDQKGKESIFIHTFFLIKKYAKTQGRTMLLRSRLLRWPAVLPGRGFFIFIRLSS